jgi:hypothetical protein
MPRTAASADHGANPVARRGELQEDRPALPIGDTVALRAKGLDRKLDWLGVCPRLPCCASLPHAPAC